MQTAHMNRRQLLDFILRPHRENVQQSLGLGTKSEEEPEMMVSWKEEDSFSHGTLPRIIRIPRPMQREFLAWAYTYLPTLRPFTAFIRLSDEDLSMYRQRSSKTFAELREAIVALIIAETVGRVSLSRSEVLKHVTPHACSNSQSYALARTFILGFPEQTKRVSAAWQVTRTLTAQKDQAFPDVDVVFRVLSNLRERSSEEGVSQRAGADLYEQACREIAATGDIGEGTWSGLTGSALELTEIRKQMIESRENRVRAFDRATNTISQISNADQTLASFLYGYLASRIAPGELDHVNLVTRTRVASSALLWFGVCSGLRSEGQILSFSNGLGQRVLRDLEQPFNPTDRPQCDLAVVELEVLLDRDKPLTLFRTEGASTLTVELAPGITTTVHWPFPGPAQSDLFESDKFLETRTLVKDLSVALDHVEYLRRRLERTLDSRAGLPYNQPDQQPRKR